MYSHRSRLEACNFGFKKKSDRIICVAKNKDANQKCSYCIADLRLCFRISKIPVFSYCSSYACCAAMIFFLCSLLPAMQNLFALRIRLIRIIWIGFKVHKSDINVVFIGFHLIKKFK